MRPNEPLLRKKGRPPWCHREEGFSHPSLGHEGGRSSLLASELSKFLLRDGPGELSLSLELKAEAQRTVTRPLDLENRSL